MLDPPRLVVAAHGTASAAGVGTLRAIAAAVGAVRPSVAVRLSFLDVLEPRLPSVLDDRPTVVVPLLLSTGFHVLHDIPSAAAPHPAVRVAAHLGPDPLIIEAVTDRLTDVPRTIVVAAGSRRPEAAAELSVAAARVQSAMARRVRNHTTVTATMADDLDAVAAAQPGSFQVATYLLAEGSFTDRIHAAVAGRAFVTPAIGADPRLVELVWRRYDSAAGG